MQGLPNHSEALQRAQQLSDWLVERAKASDSNTIKLAEIYQKSPAPCKARNKRDALFLLGVLSEHYHVKDLLNGQWQVANPLLK